VAHLQEQTFTLRETGRRSSDYTPRECAIPIGGGYFFAPSITTLKTVLSV